MSVGIHVNCQEKKGSGVARLPSRSHRIRRLIALQHTQQQEHF